MSNENIIHDAHNTIRILMEKSTWGQHADILFLTQNMQAEFDELLQGIRLSDSENAFEEAGDVFMMMLCILYKIAPSEKAPIERILKDMVTKLHRRYSQIYHTLDDSIPLNIEEENSVWQSAKRNERLLDYMFCANPDCEHFRDIYHAKITREDCFYKCHYCNTLFKRSQDNVLLFDLSNKRNNTLSIIERYVLEYSRGEQSAIIDFLEHKEVNKQFITKIAQKENALIAFSNYKLLNSIV